MANPNSSIAMATHLPQSSSPNKRLKTLPPNPQSPSSSSISKGKSKIEEDPSPSPPPDAGDESAADCCGICFSEGGFSRGQIECCDHYYCFVCIMEWAKVESRCPLCKRRFSTIRRPPKPPLCPCERVVRVPVRDQVYYHTGNATSGPPNLYSEVKCSICEGIKDESLLLLCDLCDSSAHTYCVGLGYTVPEGDWFCQDCTLLKDEHTKSESDIDADGQTNISSVEQSPTYEHISILDIVRESCGHVVPLPTSTDEVVTRNNIKRSSSTSLEAIAQQQQKPNARTLRHCRNLHDRIRVLRQNWNGFRSGDYCFSSNRGEGNNSQKSVTSRGKEDSLSSSNKQSVSQCGSSDVKSDTRDIEIQKAWEMFDKAKRSKVLPRVPKFPIGKLNPIKSSIHVSHRQVPLDSQQNGGKNVGSMGAVDHHHSFVKDCSELPSSSSAKVMSNLHVAKDINDCCEGSIISRSPALQESGSSKEIPSHLHTANTRSVRLQATETLKRQHCMESDVSRPIVPSTDEVKGVNHVSSSLNKVRLTKEKRESKKIYVDNQKYNDAKSEIQSLVKLNLKLQTKEEKLEVDAFKEIARLATHYILAACGLEDPRPRLCSVTGTNVCTHPDHTQKNSLMPSSCRECFYVFIKDVVNSAIVQKKRTRR